MAKTIEMQLRPLGRHKYPWHEWSNGEAWLLTYGEDFTVPVDSMRRAAHTHAKRTGMGIATRATKEGLVVQFFRVKKLKKFPPAKK